MAEDIGGLAIMGNNSRIGYTARLVLTILGSYGILRVITSAALSGVSDFMVILAVCIYSVICVAGIYNSRSIKKFICGTGAFFLVLAFICRSVLNRGVRYIYNDIMYALEKPYGLNLPKTAVLETNTAVIDENTTMFFVSFLVVFVVTVVVVYVHNMIGSLLSVLPVMILFVSMAAVPDVLSFFLCVSYIFGVSALHGSEGGERQAFAVLSLSLFVFLAGITLMPSYGFKRFDVFEQLNKEVKENLSWVTDISNKNEVSGIVGGGIGEGILGRAEGLRYKDVTLFTLSTIDTGKNQYFKRFIGEEYYRNRWQEELNANMKNDMQEEFIDILDSDSKLRDCVTGGTGDYYSKVRKISYTIEFVGGNREGGNYIDTDITDYSRFKKAAEQIEMSNGTYYNWKWNYYYEDEKEYRDKVYDRYLNVPDDIKDIINGLMGNVNVSTYEQKEYYIKYVKDYLSQNYAYDLIPGSVPEGKDFVEYFLLESKEGYCTYFATAATLMYRCAGIPARYVEGYVVTEDLIKKGTLSQTHVSRRTDNGKTYAVVSTASVVEVQDNAAHAWVEVYMDGYGWVPVEVTPGGGNNNEVDQNTFQEIPQNTETMQTEPVTEAETDSTDFGADVKEESEMQQDSEIHDNKEEQVNAAKTLFRNNLFLQVLVWTTVIIVLLFILIFARYFAVTEYRSVKRRNINLKKCTPKQLAILVAEEYGYLENIIAFAGYQRADGLEYEAYAGYLSEISPVFSDNNIKEVIELVLKCRFSKSGISEAEFRSLRQSVGKIRDGIYNRLGAGRKFLFKYIKLY